jgi:S-adenosylmethionine decarboxylase
LTKYAILPYYFELIRSSSSFFNSQLKGGGGLLHALGTHLLVELRDCNPDILKDLNRVKGALVSAAKEAKATIIDVSFHEFNPFGISGMVVIAESHLSIHTWPEYAYAAVDIFTCGEVIRPAVAAKYLIEQFESKNPSVVEMKRGMLSLGGEKLSHKIECAEAAVA